MTTTLDPEPVGLDSHRWRRVLELVAGWTAEGVFPAAALVVGRADVATPVFLYGRQRLEPHEAPIRDDGIFLVASITKPIVGIGVLLLVERGEILLGTRASEIIPELVGGGKQSITIRHLLTHTSGLPDMLPNNRELRAAGAPFSKFIEGICQVGLLFPPGRGVKYQSMGFALLGEVITRVTGRPYPQFLKDEIFEPLGMHDTALGAPSDWFEGSEPMVERIVEVRLPPDATDAQSWRWNSRYWRRFGAPWGGLLTTPADLAKLAQMMLRGGRVGDRQLLSTAAVAAATRNQLAHLSDVPEVERRCRPWGLAWRLNWPAHSENFGDLLGPRAYGHWGATGTLLWIDPDRNAFAVILTTRPQEPRGSFLAKLSNQIASAFH